MHLHKYSKKTQKMKENMQHLSFSFLIISFRTSLQFHTFVYRYHIFIFLNRWIVFHSVNVLQHTHDNKFWYECEKLAHLVLGVQINAVTMENCMEVPPKAIKRSAT